MKNINSLKWIITSLVASNLILLFLLVKNEQQHPNQDFKAFIIDQLNFDQAQIVAFEKEIKLHRAVMDILEQKIIITKQSLYTLNSQASYDSSEHALIVELGRLQKQVEANFMAHFKAIRNLCNQDQKHTFDKLSNEFPKFFSKPKRTRK
ncbi:MAG: hypothetical protein RLZ39_57 [Bacteroidota bacterium]